MPVHGQAIYYYRQIPTVQLSVGLGHISCRRHFGPTDHGVDILAAARVRVMCHVGRHCARAARQTVTSLINSNCHDIRQIVLSSSERRYQRAPHGTISCLLSVYRAHKSAATYLQAQKILLPSGAKTQYCQSTGLQFNLIRCCLKIDP